MSKFVFYRFVFLAFLTVFNAASRAEGIEDLVPEEGYQSLDHIIDEYWNTEVLNVEPIKKPETVVSANADPVKKPITKDQDDYADLSVLMDSIGTNVFTKTPIIVIDAGHGGKDPGTIGHRKTREKDLVLSYAKSLSRRLKNTGKYKVFLTRDKDIFLPLRKRIHIARVYNADMFISLHADAARNKKARGLSVYTLSEKASDKEAAALARKENKVDIVAGIDLSGLERDVSDALIDLSFRDAKNKSIVFAKSLHKNLKDKVKVRTNSLHSAGFVVLKNSNMASVLIELGYLSNKKDTKNLKSSSYKERLLTGVAAAIDDYFKL